MFEALRSLFGKRQAEPPRSGRRNAYMGASMSRYVEFLNSLEAAHLERQRDLARLRAHARDLARNNAYMARFVSLCQTHVIGPDGITFQSEITGNKGALKEDWNSTIEREWAAWSMACTVDGQTSLVDLEHLAMAHVARDGEVLVRRVRGYGNAWGYAVELIDADRLDHEMNETLADGRRVIMGVEVDTWGKPMAYHVWSQHPADYATGLPRMRTRIPADQILHLYREDRARGTRGTPWASPVMVQLNMLGRLWTSELAAANAESDRLGVIKTQVGMEDATSPADTAAEITSEVCTFLGLEAGQDIVFPPMQHPNAILPLFSQTLLKGIAAGLGVAYHSLSSDVADANYSASRVALLEERDNWQTLQGWFVRAFCSPVYRDWLEMAYLSGRLRLTGFTGDMERLHAPRWWPRSWTWIDPVKDEQASWNAIQHGLSTYQEELGRQNKDYRDLFAQVAAEKALMEELGISFGDVKQAAQAQNDKPQGTDEPEEDA